ncbi:MAG: cyclic pyranopterin monophosphate synthase MoaC, partial [Fimbriimonadaceae bacterium]
MRDVSAKPNSLRTARAEALIQISTVTIELIRSGNAPKGDPLGVARVAAIQAAKNTPMLIPYCHSVPLDYVGVEFELRDDSILVTVDVKAIY